MAEELIIVRVAHLPRYRFADMLAERETSGYRFLSRMVDEWERGFSRFSRHGEALLIGVTSARSA
jgi:hypothetical protein